MNDNGATELVEHLKTYRVCKTTGQYGHYRNYRNYIIYYVAPDYVAPDYVFWERDTEILAEGLPYADADALCKLLRRSEGA